MSTPILFGARYSVYARIARLVLIEKDIAFDFEEIDIFADDVAASYLERHPFKRIPALEHDGFRLFETSAITRYLDEAFPGPSLQPADLRARARMAQIIAVVDQYFYWPAVRVIFVQRQSDPCDEAAIAEARPRTETALKVLEGLADDGPWLVGAEVSLADLHLAPAWDYFRRTPECADMSGSCPKLTTWWSRMCERESVIETPFERG